MDDDHTFEDFVIHNMRSRKIDAELEKLETAAAPHANNPDLPVPEDLRQRVINLRNELRGHTEQNERTIRTAWRAEDGQIILPSVNGRDWFYEDARPVPPDLVARKRRPA